MHRSLTGHPQQHAETVNSCTEGSSTINSRLSHGKIADALSVELKQAAEASKQPNNLSITSMRCTWDKLRWKIRYEMPPPSDYRLRRMPTLATSHTYIPKCKKNATRNMTPSRHPQHHTQTRTTSKRHTHTHTHTHNKHSQHREITDS